MCWSKLITKKSLHYLWCVKLWSMNLLLKGAPPTKSSYCFVFLKMKIISLFIILNVNKETWKYAETQLEAVEFFLIL